MNIEEQRRISELTERLVQEKDPEKYLALVKEIDAIMAAKAARLRKKLGDLPKSELIN